MKKPTFWEVVKEMVRKSMQIPKSKEITTWVIGHGTAFVMGLVKTFHLLHFAAYKWSFIKKLEEKYGLEVFGDIHSRNVVYTFTTLMAVILLSITYLFNISLLVIAIITQMGAIGILIYQRYQETLERLSKKEGADENKA